MKDTELTIQLKSGDLINYQVKIPESNDEYSTGFSFRGSLTNFNETNKVI